MIEINLLPEELKVEKKKAESQRIDISKIPIKNIIIITTAVFIVSQIVAATTLLIKKNSLKKLNRLIKELEPRYNTALSLKSDIQQLGGKLSAINELTSKSILWSKKMADLSSAITEGIWLSELTLQDKKGPKGQQAMLLKGSAVSYPEGEEAAIIGEFIKSLKSNKGFFEDFEDVKLESSRIRKIKELEVMDFTIICYFKSGRRYFDKAKR